MKTRVLLLLFGALLIPCLTAGVRPLTLSQLCQGATQIVHGVVTAQNPRWEGSMIVTDWTIAPTRLLKGTGGDALRVKVPGGTIGGLTMRAGEAPRLMQGEEVILFVKTGTARCDVYGWFRGKYTVVRGQIREKRGTSAHAFLTAISEELAKQDEDK